MKGFADLSFKKLQSEFRVKGERKMKRIVFTTLSIAIFLLFWGPEAYAQHMGSGMMGSGAMTSGHHQMSSEQQKEWQQMRNEFLKETLPLRQKLVTKQMEIQTLWQAENPDSKKIKDLSDEVSDLQAQLLKKRNDFLIQSRNKFGDQGWSCPGAQNGGMGMMGGMMMGPGMMGEGRHGMGSRMMGQGYGMGPGMMYGGRGMGPGMMMNRGQGMGYQMGQQDMRKNVDENDARKMVQNYLESTGNPNLKLGKIQDKGESFEAEIQTKDGSLVDNILVDKKTGWMRSAY